MSSPVPNSMFKMPDIEVAKLPYCHFGNSCTLTGADSWYLAAELLRVCIAAVQGSRAGRLGQEWDKVVQADIGGPQALLQGGKYCAGIFKICWKSFERIMKVFWRYYEGILLKVWLWRLLDVFWTFLFVWTEPFTFRSTCSSSRSVFKCFFFWFLDAWRSRLQVSGNVCRMNAYWVYSE